MNILHLLRIWFSSVYPVWVTVGRYWKKTQNRRQPTAQTCSVVNNSISLKFDTDFDHVTAITNV